MIVQVKYVYIPNASRIIWVFQNVHLRYSTQILFHSPSYNNWMGSFNNPKMNFTYTSAHDSSIKLILM